MLCSNDYNMDTPIDVRQFVSLQVIFGLETPSTQMAYMFEVLAIYKTLVLAHVERV